MAITLAEEVVEKYDTEDVVSFIEAEVKTMRQMALSKEPDKSFTLGKISVGLTNIASLLEALRKKLKPETKEEPPVVAG